MKKSDWQEIIAARDLLGLGETASLQEIKQAFRRQAKRHHPDGKTSKEKAPADARMAAISEAYQFLLAYCTHYRFPLSPDYREHEEAEDWWMDRFGQDPLWGKGGK